MDFVGIRDHFNDHCVKIHSKEKIESLDLVTVEGKIYLIFLTKKVNKNHSIFHLTNIHIYEQ